MANVLTQLNINFLTHVICNVLVGIKNNFITVRFMMNSTYSTRHPVQSLAIQSQILQICTDTQLMAGGGGRKAGGGAGSNWT